MCLTCPFLILMFLMGFYGVSKPKNNSSIFHMHGATQCAKKAGMLFKISEHWVIANGMITEKQNIKNLYFSILTRCHHNSQKQSQVRKRHTGVL